MRQMDKFPQNSQHSVDIEILLFIPEYHILDFSSTKKATLSSRVHFIFISPYFCQPLEQRHRKNIYCHCEAVGTGDSAEISLLLLTKACRGYVGIQGHSSFITVSKMKPLLLICCSVCFSFSLFLIDVEIIEGARQMKMA